VLDVGCGPGLVLDYLPPSTTSGSTPSRATSTMRGDDQVRALTATKAGYDGEASG
jgi:hypothetical protein